MATNKKINELKRAESESSETQAGSSASATPTLSRTPTGELMQTTVTLSRPDGEAQEAMSTTIEHEVAAKVRLDEDSGRLHLYNAKRAPKVKRLVTFRPQLSSFDRFNPNTSTDLFRGFYTLFWIFLAIMVIRTGLKSWHEERTIVGMTFARLIGSDGLVLALSDLALVSSTILCVPFMQLVEKGYIPYSWLGILLQHLGQAGFLASAITWTFFREWYWVQSGFLTLHSITMLMKVHSYLTFNGNASIKRAKLKKQQERLDGLLLQAGGKDQCLSVARPFALQHVEGSPQHAEAKAPSKQATSAASQPSTLQVSSEAPEPSAAEDDGSGLRRRRSRCISVEEAEKAAAHKATTTNSASTPVSDMELHVLCFSPNESIAQAANDAADLADDLTAHPRAPSISSTSEKISEPLKYPHNLTYGNFIDYLIVPTLVYELDYPRTQEIRPLYLLEKTLATFGTFSLLYIITEHYILPVTNARAEMTFWELALDLTTPFMVNYVLIFYIIFECICNGFAELSRFADRGFYDDWWNSISFDEFARKWNKPVHNFLLRHVYASSMSAYRLSKFQASFATFLLSACLHELVMAVVSKKFRMYLFLMQMAQLPLILVGRASVFKRHPGIGNIFFWVGLMSGFPLLAVGYLKF